MVRSAKELRMQPEPHIHYELQQQRALRGKRATLAGSRPFLLRPAVTTSESPFVQTPLLPTCQPVAASGHTAEVFCALCEAELEV